MADASKKTVLIIDDDADARFAFSAILNHDGYRVLLAANGEEGVKLAVAQRPDIIVMDLQMPVMDGWYAAAELRKDVRTREIPIVAVTGECASLDSDPTSAAALFHSWFGKPVRPKYLMSHIQAIIGDP